MNSSNLRLAEEWSIDSLWVSIQVAEKDMALASTITVVLGSISFFLFWVVAVFPSLPCLPIGRTAGSLLGGLLMVVFKILSPNQAFSAVDLSVLGLLFGTMVVTIYLERADMFQYLGCVLSWRNKGGKDLLCRICLVSAIASALFTNDTCCVVLTEFVLKICRHKNLPPLPYLLALASSANIGSAATPIGNPQNLVIAMHGHISFGKFLADLVLAMLVGILVNCGILLLLFWNGLRPKMEDGKEGFDCIVELADLAEDESIKSHRFSPPAMSRCGSGRSRMDVDGEELNQGNVKKNEDVEQKFEEDLESDGGCSSSRVQNAEFLSENSIQIVEESLEELRSSGSKRSVECVSHGKQRANDASVEMGKEVKKRKKNWREIRWKLCVYVVTLGMLVALLFGLDMSWTAIAAAIVLTILDFTDAGPSFDKVSYSLLVFFAGMFITVDGFNKTGIPTTFWDSIEPHAHINSVSGMAVLSLTVILLSNIASNVPTVLLLGPQVAASAAKISPTAVTKAWLILAWVSTVAGNLTLIGSAANLIVCEQARKVQSFGYYLSFWNHIKFGIPATLIVVAVGLPLIRSS